MILAEDGDEDLIAASPDGEKQPIAIARNALNGSEFAGVTFDQRLNTLEPTPGPLD